MVRTIIASIQAKPDCVDKLKAKLQEAADVYVKDKGTLSWTVLQDPKDKTKFGLVERYEDAAAVGVHAKNPYFKEFGAYIRPLVVGPSALAFYDEVKDAKAKL